MMRVTGHQFSLLYVLPKSSVKVTNVLLSSNVSFSTSLLGPFCIEVGYLVFVVVFSNVADSIEVIPKHKLRKE